MRGVVSRLWLAASIYEYDDSALCGVGGGDDGPELDGVVRGIIRASAVSTLGLQAVTCHTRELGRRRETGSALLRPVNLPSLPLPNSLMVTSALPSLMVLPLRRVAFMGLDAMLSARQRRGKLALSTPSCQGRGTPGPRRPHSTERLEIPTAVASLDRALVDPRIPRSHRGVPFRVWGLKRRWQCWPRVFS